MCVYDVLFNVDVDCCVVVFNGSKVLLILCVYYLWFMWCNFVSDVKFMICGLWVYIVTGKQNIIYKIGRAHV